mmetsp:Transcript_67847/g.189409  ORF Transcript_67847/g.189409 Transcript_67847/m.189409 type:complete len:246 (+) Transcript_67847:492-1229(+)
MPRKASRSSAWTNASVCMSMDAVGSSQTSTRRGRRSTRAKQRSCRSPADNEPSAPTDSSSWRCGRCVATSARQSSSSVNSPNGSKLKRAVPFISTGSCGIIARAVRKAFKPNVCVSMPSSKTWPLKRGVPTRRNKATITELFPAPLLPIMPTRVPPTMRIDKPHNTSGAFSRYLKRTLTNSRSPLPSRNELDNSRHVLSVPTFPRGSDGMSPCIMSKIRSMLAPQVNNCENIIFKTIKNMPNTIV